MGGRRARDKRLYAHPRVRRAWPAIVEFMRRRDDFADLSAEVARALREQLTTRKVQIDSVSARVKGFDNLVEKIKRKAYKDPLAEVEDLAAARVVYLYMHDRDYIERIIRQTFDLVREPEYNTPSGERGYKAVHYIVRLRKPHPERLRHLKCEIQVRSVLQDAWALVDHHLLYKRDRGVPRKVREQLIDLAAGFEKLDDQFEDLRRHELRHRARLREKPQFLEEKPSPESLELYVRRRFPDVEPYDDLRDLWELVEDLISLGYRSLEEVEKFVAKHAQSVRARSKVLQDKSQITFDFGVWRAAACLARSPRFKKNSKAVDRYQYEEGGELFRGRGWSKDVAP